MINDLKKYNQLFLIKNQINKNLHNWGLGIGDGGLGIGDWAQSPIPNPQSPIPNPQSPIHQLFYTYTILFVFYKEMLYLLIFNS